ncbi:Monoacylglycerol lipase ABHD12 [Neolecta irregularis DAH-3]|uniref:Monoacylglycerol lipase ABHD12 n=1 Tax=Neolecta irregularis (strain DAH-3) TaxID=1198029 RepID=A0A1U7LQ23_NEOID|nr:Monoacylglycerol lipase ABHD12 [Neolecta irregularis DAH-3]|eukprot:OLL24744.1 Monoacylglycerol lipase ABHD12 [Neolecta irregularis DAH-3]
MATTFSLLRAGWLFLLVLGILYMLFLTALAVPVLQRAVQYAHVVRLPYVSWLQKPEMLGFAPGRVHSMFLPTADGQIVHTWHIRPLHSSSKGSLVDSTSHLVVYFHGNAGTLASQGRRDFFHAASALPNTHVLAIDYRGFGQSSGSPSEEGLILDGLAAVQWALDQGIDPSRIAIVGQSLGSAVCIATAERLASMNIHVKALVLIAGFTSVPDLLSTFRNGGVFSILGPLQNYPLLQKWLINTFVLDKWDSANRLHLLVPKLSTETSILIIHAHNDFHIPYSHSVQLYETARALVPHDLSKNEMSGVDKHFSLERAGKQVVKFVETSFGGHNQVQNTDASIIAIGKALGVLHDSFTYTYT